MDTASHASTEALIHLDAISGEDWEDALREVLRVDSNVLGVECVSYWRFRQASAIVCELGYRQTIKSFDRGLELRSAEAPAYFDEIRRSPILAVEDALQDERTRDLRGYLSARHIGALLDTAVRVEGQVVGILCHEHVGGTRRWSEQEQQLAFAIGQIIATRVAARSHTRSEERERKAALLADVMTDVAEAFGSAAAAQVAVDHAGAPRWATSASWSRSRAKRSATWRRRTSTPGLIRLQTLLRDHPPSLNGPGFAAHVLREQESLLVPDADVSAARYFGIEGPYLDHVTGLGVRSAMAAPFAVRGVARGAMVFGSSFLHYDQNDLKFAEAYAQRVGLILENGRLYRRAEDAIKARDEFLSLASHELRTPLTSIGLYAQSIVRSASALPAGELTSLGQGMVRQAGRLDRLAERLLSAAELRAGEADDRPRADRRLRAGARPRARVLGRGLRREIVAGVTRRGPGDGYVDPTRIEQVLGNLIDNAVKFGMGNPIEVELRARSGEAVISVRDHGPGIPLEEQGKIFERYLRGSAAAGVGGLGLGLHVVRQIIELHGGSVRVDARPGEGSTFTVTLPLDPPS